MFEYIDKAYYDDVNEQNLTEYFNNKYYSDPQRAEVCLNIDNSTTPFKAILSVTKYNETEGNTEKLDLVKEIDMSVTYRLGSKDQTIQMTKTKKRETLITPNAPDLKLLEQDEYNIYPIKKVEDNWIVCNQYDSSWYDYVSGKWALALKTNTDLEIGEQVDLNNLLQNETVYAWIPRFAYDSTNSSILFLFSNSNSFVENNNSGYAVLTEISNTYSVSQDFSSGTKQLVGIWTSTSTSESYQELNSVYTLEQ